MFVYKQLHPAAAIICAVATLTIAPDAAPIPIPSLMTPTKIAPTDNMPESAANMPEPAAAMPESTAISSATIPISPEPEPISPEPHLIPPEPTVKLGSWHEIVIAKPAIITASPAITISHPAIRINTISTHAARVSACTVWLSVFVASASCFAVWLSGIAKI